MSDQDELDPIVDMGGDIANQAEPLPLPDGVYEASIDRAIRKPGKSNPDNSVAHITFHVDATQYPADYREEGDPSGVLLTTYLALAPTPKGRFRVKEFCDNIGAPEALQGNLFDITQLPGRLAQIRVEVEETAQYGKQARIVEVLPLS